MGWFVKNLGPASGYPYGFSVYIALGIISLLLVWLLQSTRKIHKAA